jgi:hypothetical protein
MNIIGLEARLGPSPATAWVAHDIYGGGLS